ncbi:MAG TPA: galactokinase [Blastocatellia bacterium]|nr:galactokinase [Blastocatellia bacterium]
MTTPREVSDKFKSIYKTDSHIYRAPGRVNLIGEHTDYNEGFVMPAAIDFYTWVAISNRNNRRLAIYSENYSDAAEIDLDDHAQVRRNNWADYPFGVALTLERAGYTLNGANLYIKGDVPIGAGLSSSAAIEVATGVAVTGNSGIEINRAELAKLCQQAEHQFAGTRCGIMDQFIACNAQANHALMLDCRSLDFELLPLPESASLVICNSMVKHELAGSQYNARRAECEAGVQHLQKSLPDVKALRDVDLGELERFGKDLSKAVYKRCRHVISENQRVQDAAAALKAGDLTEFGKFMYESHRSLRDDYEVSCAELDILVDLADDIGGVYGARLTGGGFGGCVIALVDAKSVSTFKDFVAAEYERKAGVKPEIYVSKAANGAEQITI